MAKQVDWIALWILNELVRMPNRLYDLIHNVRRQPSSYWLFPDAPMLKAGCDTRAKALAACTDRGWLKLAPQSWLEDTKIGKPLITRFSSSTIADIEALKSTWAILTSDGHEKWESEFEPDWQRFWTWRERRSENNKPHIELTVSYAGNEIFDELQLWLPVYFDLESSKTFEVVNCDTTFRYPVALWKVLPYLKIAVFRGQTKVDELRQLNECALRVCGSSEDHFWRFIREHFKARKQAIQKATRIIFRLSKKWDCDASDELDGYAPREIV